MTVAREWIIFSLCLGAGGHLALAFVLHAPEFWPWSRAGLWGLISGLVLYAIVQLLRFSWRCLRREKDLDLLSQD